MPAGAGRMLLGKVAAGAVWVPDDVTGLFCWYDMSDTATITDSSGSVSQVDDKSTSGLDVTQSNGSRKPTTNSRTQNSLNVVDFDGGDYLKSATFTQAQPIHVFAAFVNDVTAATQHRLWSGNSTPTAYMFSNTYRIYANSVVDSGDSTDTSVHYRADLFDGTTCDMRLDGVEIGTGDAGTAGFATDPFALGSVAGGGSEYWNGAICEVFGYDAELTGTDLSDAESYLADKWVP